MVDEKPVNYSNDPKTQVNKIDNLGKLGIFRVQSLDVKFSNGAERVYYRIYAKQDAVGVIAIDGEDLILISEYSAGTLDYRLGFVRGGIDEGEDLYESARRELSEEAGYIANKYTYLREVHNSTGYQTGKMIFILAEDLYPDPNPLDGDEPEPLEIVRWPLAKIDELLVDPRFSDARNLVALYYLRDFLAQRAGSKE